MNILRFLALCILTGFPFATWATCEPPPSEKTYQPTMASSSKKRAGRPGGAAYADTYGEILFDQKMLNKLDQN